MTAAANAAATVLAANNAFTHVITPDFACYSAFNQPDGTNLVAKGAMDSNLAGYAPGRTPLDPMKMWERISLHLAWLLKPGLDKVGFAMAPVGTEGGGVAALDVRGNSGLGMAFRATPGVCP